MTFGYFLSVTRLPFELAGAISEMAMNRYLILIFLLFIYIVLGCMITPMAIIVLTIPIVYPLILDLGFDPIWFGIITVRIVEIAQITPPVGMNVFIIKGVAGDVSLGTVYRGIIPFFIADMFHLAILIIFPQLALWLPSLMG
jgi:TRAP-type C4-dicarboxylate transport system permease large subunit